MRRAILLLFFMAMACHSLDASNSDGLNESDANSTMICRAPNETSTISSCTITYLVNGTKENSIEVGNACNTLKDIIKNKVDNILISNSTFDAQETEIESFLGKNTAVARMVYVITLKNVGDPELHDVILEVRLCDGLKYESSSQSSSNTHAIFYDPTVIQDKNTHTTSKLNWSIGSLNPDETRTIVLNTLYERDRKPPIIPNDTKFEMEATVWGYKIVKQNDGIRPKPVA